MYFASFQGRCLMKVFRAMSILMILLSPLTAIAAEHYFVRALGGPSGDLAYATTSLGERIYFAGVKDRWSTEEKALLLATDYDGNLVFEKAFLDPSGGSPRITALAAGNGVVYAGGSLDSYPCDSAFVMMLSTDGDILLQKSLQSAQQSYLTDLIVTQDRGLLLVGNLYTTGGGPSDGWVVKLDATGAILWQKVIGTAGEVSLNSVVERPEGGFVLAGKLTNPWGRLGWLLELDANGNVLWQKLYAVAMSDAFSKVLLTPDGITALGTAGVDGWIVNTNDNGDILSAQFIGDFSVHGMDSILDAWPAPTARGFFAVGITRTTILEDQILVGRFDGRGGVRWLHHIGESDALNWAGSLAVLDGGDIAFGGFTVRAGQQFDVYIGKLDKNGRALGACDQVFPLSADLRDDGGMTIAWETMVPVADWDAVLIDGTLMPGVSPTTLDELLCFD
jgi:hypothetical protein